MPPNCQETTHTAHDQTQSDTLLAKHGLVSTKEKLITWHPDSRYHPRMWSSGRKWLNVAFVLAAEAQSAAMSTAGTAAADAALSQFRVSRTLAYFVFTTIAIIAEAVASLVTPAFSESYGRRPQYVSAAVASCIGNGLAAVPHPAAVAIGRFVSGFAGGVPPAISPGAIEDIFEDPTIRTWALFAWASASNAGLAGGPILSSILTDRLGWQSTFYGGVISSFALASFALLFKESRPSTVLQNQIDRLRKESGDDSFHMKHPDQITSWQSFFVDTLARPTRLFLTEPIVFMISMLDATAYGLIYGLTGAVTVVYRQFGFSPVQSNLAFVAILIGTFLTVFCRLWDEIKIRRMQRQGKPIGPEDKIDTFAFSTFFLAAGLWLFSWTIPQAVQIPWPVSMVGLVAVGFAANDFTTVLSSYLVDAYGPYAASAFAAVGWARSLVSAALTLAITPMFENLGSNVAGTIFAAVATLFCVSPFVLKLYGKRLREQSPFAVYSLRIAEETRLGAPSSFESEVSSLPLQMTNMKEKEMV